VIRQVLRRRVYEQGSSSYAAGGIHWNAVGESHSSVPICGATT